MADPQDKGKGKAKDTPTNEEISDVLSTTGDQDVHPSHHSLLPLTHSSQAPFRLQTYDQFEEKGKQKDEEMAGEQLDRSAPVADAASLPPFGDGPEVGGSQGPRAGAFYLDLLSEMPRPSNESRRIYEGLRVTDPDGFDWDISRPNRGMHIWQQAQPGTWLPNGGIWLEPPVSERAERVKTAGPRDGILIMPHEQYISLHRAPGSEGVDRGTEVSIKRKHDEVPAADAQLDRDNTMSATPYRNNYDAAYPPLDDDSDMPPDRKRQKMLVPTNQGQMQPYALPMSQLPDPQASSQQSGHGRAAQGTISPTSRNMPPIKNESDSDQGNEDVDGHGRAAQGIALPTARNESLIEDESDPDQGEEDVARNMPFIKDALVDD